MKKIVFNTITITIVSTFLYSQDIWTNGENAFFNHIPSVSATDNDRDIPHYRQKQLNKLTMRKKYDLFGATLMYGFIIITELIRDDGRKHDILLVPVIGHLYSGEWVPEPLETPYGVAGIMETLFLIDYGITSYRIRKINKKYSYQLNINPIIPSASLSFNF